MPKTAILVDGSFYLRRARSLWGNISAPERVDELMRYAQYHILRNNRARLEGGKRSLYRVFYYDCPPVVGKSVYQPWNGRNTTFGRTNLSYQWNSEFQDLLASRTKVAMRMGTVTTTGLRYVPKKDAMKDLASGVRAFSELEQSDFELVGMKQSGVDMKIGLDVASLSQGRVVDQIILIADDTDFIPAIKTARRAGVDFLLDPLGNHVSKELLAQVDDLEDLHESFRASSAKIVDDQADGVVR